MQVRENDGFPKYSCTKCAQDVKAALITKKRIIKSHKAILEHLKRKRAQVTEQPTILIIENEDESVHHPVVPQDSSSRTSTAFGIGQPKPHGIETKIEFVAVNCPPLQLQSLAKADQIKSNKLKTQNKQRSANETLKNKIVFKPKTDPFVCEICNLEFAYRSEFTLHKNKHKKSQCEICNALIRTDNFRKHLMLHSAEPMNCKLCGTTCKNIESLRGHIYYQHKMKADTYVCEECGKKFRTKYKFSLHKKKEHTGIRAFKCETCGKGFFTRGNLLTHDRMTHKKLRPHICEFCGTGFSSSYALKTHKRQHTNEKPYVCDFCDEGFRQRVSLRAHLKSKHGYEEPKEAICQQCGKGFANTYALNVHERLHLNAEKCDLCSDSFADKEYLKAHLTQVHSVKMETIEVEEVQVKQEENPVEV